MVVTEGDIMSEELFCPQGCGATLRSQHNTLVCVAPDCPDPDSVTKLLGEGLQEHRLVIKYGRHVTWTLKHPLCERIDDDLFECPFNQWESLLSNDTSSVVGVGEYRMIETNREISLVKVG